MPPRPINVITPGYNEVLAGCNHGATNYSTKQNLTDLASSTISQGNRALFWYGVGFVRVVIYAERGAAMRQPPADADVTSSSYGFTIPWKSKYAHQPDGETILRFKTVSHRMPSVFPPQTAISDFEAEVLDIAKQNVPAWSSLPPVK